ncbi:uncharacterized protein (DUF4415 family) [Variovorax paradoxus]|uniref:BrnA antitoxin family protein n=1 Tax=Variovorax paradoxus TaxID=34073 RepID=UPI002792913B|nr:BrnA antitoxin family protein [Variovorax paradoxus]MDQ0570017.1 uncharacterized protein (DUF4415 family) [Variovorax paradoxus]
MPKIDKEMVQFEKDLLQSIGEMKRGEHAAVHTPEQIGARKRGRPAGTVKETPTVSTTIRFDADVLEALKSGGRGWQTRVNDVIRSVFISDTREEAVALARDLGKAPARRGKGVIGARAVGEKREAIRRR